MSLIGPADPGVLAAAAQLVGVIRAGGQDVELAPALQLVIQQADLAAQATLTRRPAIDATARFIYAASMGSHRVAWERLLESSRDYWRLRAAGAITAALTSGTGS